MVGSGEGSQMGWEGPQVKRIFLDDAGGAPILPEVAVALRSVPDGNPSSLHAEGRSARADLAHAVGALVHIDAGAGPRWIPIPDGADIVSLSGHKLGAGRGGAIYVKDGLRIDPLFYGGPQEWGRRAGHEDIASAVAFAAAIAVSARDRNTRASEAQKRSTVLRTILADLGGHLTGADDRLPNFASCSFGDRKGQALLLALDIAGIAASSGSACASGSLDPSHVLLAMGLSLDEALGSLRLTTGYATTSEEISRARDIITVALTRSPARA